MSLVMWGKNHQRDVSKSADLAAEDLVINIARFPFTGDVSESARPVPVRRGPARVAGLPRV